MVCLRNLETLLHLFDNAFDEVGDKTFASLDELCEFIKRIYTKTRSLDQIREDFENIRQGLREPVVLFGNKIEALLREATKFVKETYGVDNMEGFFKDLAVNAFV